MGASAVCASDGKVIAVDLSGLIRRLLLFDKYVLESVKLGEFPVLARCFGYEGLRDLLAAKLIEIRCECLQLGKWRSPECSAIRAYHYSTTNLTGSTPTIKQSTFTIACTAYMALRAS